jgi:mono/diheme cytochrome c family protein
MSRLIALLALFAVCWDESASADTDTLVARGSYLVNTIMACGNCHTPRDADGALITERALSGGLMITTPAFVATAPNITPDRDTGIGGWSDADIKHALIAGIRPDHGRLAGVALAAAMPVSFYKALLSDDLDAIVAYLHTVKPVRNLVADPVYKAPVRREPYPEAEAGFSLAEFGDPVRRGAYLATIGHCMECHSTVSSGTPDFSSGLGHGGRRFGTALIQGLGGAWKGAVAPNITADPTDGIGAWSDQEIARAIRHGIARTGIVSARRWRSRSIRGSAMLTSAISSRICGR